MNTMNPKKETKKFLSINLIISSLIWAIVIIACSLSSVSTKEEITLILLSGFFMEFLRITSMTNPFKKDTPAETV